jgi:glycosyltransferase involved in cell wall biosynthesis
MRTVLVTAWTPALGSGRAMRVFGVVKALSLSGEVDLVWRRFDAPAPSAEYLALAPQVRLHEVLPPAPPVRIRDALAARARGVPADMARGALSAFADRAAGLAGRDARIIADGLVCAGALLPLARRRDVVFLAHNFESGFRATPALERFERRLFETFAETWHCTQADVDGARAFAPRARTQRVVPNVIDLDAIVPAPPVPPTPPRIVLVADFSYAPNREGLDLLLDEVLPRVFDAVPEARAAIAGRQLPERATDPRVELAGFVEDLGAFYRSAAAAVVPLLRGGGSPLKFAEALAHGVPVVTTEHAARMLEGGRPGEHFLAARDAEGLAGALVEVLRGAHPGLGAAGRRLAAERASVASIADLVAG